jgi:hypothetical protein
MKRGIVTAIVATPIALVLFGWVALKSLTTEHLSICASSPGAYRIPSGICRFYFEHFTGAKDARELEQGVGLAFSFGVEDKIAREAILDRLLEIGVNVNGISQIDGLTPINAAILLNDRDLVRKLLAHGANPEIRDKSRGMDAHQFLQLLQAQNPNIDRTGIAQMLGG